MKLHLDSKYQGDKKKMYPFPSEDIPQSKKDRSYFLKCAQAIITKHINNLCDVPYGAIEGGLSIYTLRQYGIGKQGVDRYKDLLIGRKNRDGNRPKSTVNINWKPLDILPKKLADVVGYLQKMKYDVVTTAIDPMAAFSKDMAKAATKLTTDELFKNLHIEINEAAGGLAVDPGGQLVGQAASAIPFQNAQQVDGFAATGGFQLLQEIAMKILIDKTSHDSASDVLDSMLIMDLLNLGKCGKMYYSVPGSDNVLEDYIDMAEAIVPFSLYPDYRDKTYAGRKKSTSIGEIRRTSDLEEKDIIEIARTYNSAPFNAQHCLPNFDYDLQNARETGLGIAILDSIMVDVADVQWLGTKSEAQTRVFRKKEGNLALNKVSDDYEISKEETNRGKELKKYKYQTVYRAKLIVGTDFVYDYGQAYDITYKKDENGFMVPEMSFSFFKIPGPSMTEKCTGFVDDANMALFKKRMIIKNLGTGPNIKINKSAFENVKIDDKLMNPADLMALFRDEGFLIVDDSNPWGDKTGSSRPIDIIPSDVVQRLTECRNDLEWNVQMIELITGLNSIFSAASPTSETGLGVSKIAIKATENSIYTIIEAREKHKEAGYKICSNMWKIKAANMNEKKRENFATDRAMRYIRLGKEISTHEYNMALEAGITEDEKLMLQQKVIQLGDFRRQAGQGGIKPSDELMVFDIIKSGNIKLARLVLAQLEEYRAAEDERIAEKRYAENAQLQQQSNQQASENKQAEIEAKGNVEKSIKLAELQAEMQLEEMKGRNARVLSAQNNIFGWGLDSYKKTVKQ